MTAAGRVEAPRPFSDARAAGGILYLSGQHAGTPAGPVGGGDMYAQAREALRRVVSLAAAAGAGTADIVKLTIYATDMARNTEIGRARREVFAGPPYPCATLVEVRALVDPRLLVEIEAIVALPAGTSA